MNERVVDMLKALMRAYPPDMVRNMEDDVVTDAPVVQKACYSGTQLQNMLNDQPLVNAICRANEGTPMWAPSVFNFLLGWLSGSASELRS